MGGFRRFVLFVISVAGLCGLAAVALPWLGYFPAQFAALERHQAYVLAVEVCLGILVLWLVYELGRSLLSRRVTAISVMDIDGGQITVTKSAVASQASHVVEECGLGVAKHVEVEAGRRGPVRVTVKVTPYESIDVTQEAPVLHEALVAGLTAMVGVRLGTVDLEFLEPQQASSLVTFAEEDAADQAGPEDGAAAAPAQDAWEQAGDPIESRPTVALRRSGAAAEPEPPAMFDTGDITIPMRAEREE